MNGKFDRLIDAVGQMHDELKTAAKQQDLQEVKADVKVVKAAVTDLSHIVKGHETLLAELNTAH